MYKVNKNGCFLINLTTAEEAFLFMMMEENSQWKHLYIQDDETVTILYYSRAERDADYEAIKHMMKK